MKTNNEHVEKFLKYIFSDNKFLKKYIETENKEKLIGKYLEKYLEASIELIDAYRSNKDFSNYMIKSILKLI